MDGVARRRQAAIERASETGIDVAFDTFPYTGGNTTIRVVYPGWVQHDLPENLGRPGVRRRLRAEFLVLRRLLKLDLSDIQLLWGANPALTEFEGSHPKLTETVKRLIDQLWEMGI